MSVEYLDLAEHAVLAVASGEWVEARTAAWLRPQLAPVDDA